MMKVAQVPKHYQITLEPREAFDLIITLRAAARDYGEFAPESMQALLETLEHYYDGDLPQPITNLDDLDPTTA